MAREKQARRARGLRGKAETAGGERRLDLGLRQGGPQHPALQPFFQGPGGVLDRSGLDDEKQRRVEAEGTQARPIRASPFPRGALGEAPQHEIPGARPLDRLLGNHGKGKTERRGAIAVGFGPQLMQPSALEPAQRKREGRKKAGGAGKGRARCGGIGQRHGNLLDRADLRA